MQQDEFGIYDIYTFIHIPFWQKMWFKGVLICLAVITIGFFIWWLLNIFIFSKKRKDVSPRQIVLQKLEHIRQAYAVENKQKLYADLGFILRLFFTDIHGRDMLSFTEKELINHFDDCDLCLEIELGFALGDYLTDVQGHDTVSFTEQEFKEHVRLESCSVKLNKLLEQMSNVKYNAEIVVHNDLVINDIDFVTILVHSVYFKK